MINMELYEQIVPSCFLFVDRRCFPDWEIIKQKIDFHDLTFVVEGKANYYVNGEKHTVEAGDMIYIPEGNLRQAHTFKESPMHSYAFNFYMHPDNGLHLPFETVTKKHITVEILSYIREFTQVWMSKQPGYQMHARGLLTLIIHRLLTISFHQTSSVHADNRINKVKGYIIDHYSEDLDLSSVAGIVNLHPVYLSKLFKANTNYSFKEFLNLIRINNAEMMLRAGGFSVSEVAERCGFRDISYFSNVFKAIKGFPPSTLRK
ncbi:helix-turn-helix transcriptional regulator [Paenibacillus hamazuiensis]|uniref:helix-turn-helix transcriptional regulator n=1 Tax=Paenibacillus hamazuiensis TaxID=2936508 RepID=UPI002010BE7D|nr:helix-turn-helix domain-containing protein [Paenibacillus hamazuiensis]